MLILSRGVGESIVIGGEIVVTVIEIKGGKVRIGVDAPREIAVDREEVDDAKRRRPRMLD